MPLRVLQHPGLWVPQAADLSIDRSFCVIIPTFAPCGAGCISQLGCGGVRWGLASSGCDLAVVDGVRLVICWDGLLTTALEGLCPASTCNTYESG
jgi:hypothetical protein